MDYPRMLYKSELRKDRCIVQSDEERDAKLAEGWSLWRPCHAPKAEKAGNMEAAIADMAAQSQAEADHPKKRGRKPSIN